MMKYKHLIKLLIMLMIFSISCVNTYAAEEYFYDGAWQKYTALPVSLFMEGRQIQCDVPPLIIENRTLVPARAVFETLGATVNWNEKNGEVTIKKDNLNVSLTIGSKTGYINGQAKKMDVPAKIVEDKNQKGRTLVPVRFISENIGLEVDWNERDTSVFITMPKISEIKSSTVGEKDIVEITTMTDRQPKVSFLSSPDRLVVDFIGFELSIPDGATNKEGKHFENIRWAYHSGQYTRVVIDLIGKPNYSLEKEGDKLLIILSEEKDIIKDNTESSKKSKIVVIDPGHGGSDPGAVGYVDEEMDLMEKEPNLDISLQVYEMLMDEGVEVVITRKTDVFVGLSERAKMANDIGASLFVSIHNNSFTNPDVNGSMVFFYDSNQEIEEYGISGKKLAYSIQAELGKLETRDRGIANGSQYLVLNQTDMPAVIVEGAFISNLDDRELLKSAKFKTEIAQAITKGIINALDDLK